MNRNLIRICLLAVVLGATGGCVREESDGNTHVFTYELWVPLSVVVVGFGAVPAGWFLRQKSARFGWSLVVIGPLAAIALAPSLLRDRVVLDETSFSRRSGIWGLTSVQHVYFDDLRQVRITFEVVRGRRGRDETNYYLLCEQKDGSQVKIPLANSVIETAAPHFLEKVSNHAIPILDET